MRSRRYQYHLSFSEIEVQVTDIGQDCQITIGGGERPHVGCVVLAIPRPSLTGDGSISVTSSVINVTGHKDEELCRLLAEQVAKAKNAVTVCTGGFHIDHASAEMIQEVAQAVQEIAETIVAQEHDFG
ncbi:MAG: hypothetical protein ACI39W_04305 [Brotaphodocola sp.]